MATAHDQGALTPVSPLLLTVIRAGEIVRGPGHQRERTPGNVYNLHTLYLLWNKYLNDGFYTLLVTIRFKLEEIYKSYDWQRVISCWQISVSDKSTLKSCSHVSVQHRPPAEISPRYSFSREKIFTFPFWLFLAFIFPNKRRASGPPGQWKSRYHGVSSCETGLFYLSNCVE